jgi:mRNA interferase YafQ
MYILVSERRFEKSVERLRQGRNWNEERVRAFLKLLVSGEPLPAICKDHQLKGDMSAYRECHIKHDLLLQYVRDEKRNVIVLVNIGTHQDFFGR